MARFFQNQGREVNERLAPAAAVSLAESNGEMANAPGDGGGLRGRAGLGGVERG